MNSAYGFLRKQIIAVVFLLSAVTGGFAQQIYFQKKSAAAIDTLVPVISAANSPFIEINDSHYPKKITGIPHTDTKTRLSFLIDPHVHSYLGDSAYYQIELKILWANQHKDTFQYIGPLIIDYKKTGESNDRSEFQWLDAYWVQAKVLRIKDRQGNILPFNTLPASLSLELSIETNERYSCPPNVNYSLSAAFHPAGKQIKIHWNALPCASFYELEWTYADDYRQNTSAPVPASQLKYYFPRKAMRVRTHQNFYALPAVFGRGYVIFRVRGAVKDTAGNVQYLNWSMGDNYNWQTRKGINSISTVPSPSKIYISENNRYEPKKNYAYEFVSDEEGKAHHRIAYYDGLLLKKQEIDLFSPASGDSIAIVKEWLYDVLGRPSVETLPSVEWKPGYLNYYPNLNLDSASGIKYSYPHFMKNINPNCFPSIIPNPMSENSGAGRYYSGSNANLAYWQMQQTADRMIPDAEHYPFRMQIYSNEPGNRVKQTGAAGKIFQPGNEHAVKYFYGSPTQEELDRLLGNNAGFAGFYTKTLTKDENGQFTVDIKDISGKTVINGLEKKAPNLEEVDTSTTLLTSILIQKDSGQVSDGEQIVMPERDWSKTMVSSGGDVSATYSVTVPSFTDPCKNTECYDCVYQWEMNIKDECGQSYWTKNNWTSGTADDIVDQVVCQSSTRNFSADTTALIPPSGGGGAEIYLHRKMLLDSLAMENYFQLWLQNNPCVKSEQDFLEDELSQIDSSLCDLGCDDCGTDSLCIKTCQDSFASLPLCEYARMLMEADMLPMGQYAKYDQDALGNISVPASEIYSVFDYSYSYPYLPKTRMWGNVSPVNLPNKPGAAAQYPMPYQYPNTYISGLWQPYYADEDGKKDTVWLDTDRGTSNNNLYDTTKKWNHYGIYYTFPQHLTRKSFINNFKFSWAKSLLVYHPEFYYWWNCIGEVQPQTSVVKGFSLNTFSFDDTLANHPEWLMDTNFACHIWQKDPFFVSLSGTNGLMGDDWNPPYRWNAGGGWCPPFTASAQSRLENKILNFAAGKSLYQLADKIVHCNAPWNNNVCFALDTSSGSAQLFAERYSAAKRDIIMEYLHKCAMLTQSYNGSIGPHAKQHTELWAYYDCTPVSSSAHPYFDNNQTSNVNSYAALKNKIKRWGKSEEYIGDTTLTSQSDSVTGLEFCQCKNEQALEALLQVMFNDSNLIGTKNIDTCFLFTPALYALTGGAFTWNSYLSNNNKTLEISTGGNCNIGIPGVTIELEIDTPAYLTWHYPKLVSLQNLHYTSTVNNVQNFKLSLWYKDSSDNYQITELKGRTCFPLNDCGKNAGSASADSCLTFDFPPVDSIEIDSLPDPCLEAQVANAAFNAQNHYEIYMDSLREDFYQRYRTTCWKIKELLAVRYKLKGNYYTLYNYDEAGNLLQTIPPGGIVILDSAQMVQVKKYRDGLSNTPLYPNDSLKSEYRYNSQNLETQRKTPDAGITNSYYDLNLRLAATQNAQQKHDTLFAFTKYDYKSRPVEAGIGKSAVNFIPTPAVLSQHNHPDNWLLKKREVVKTLYDLPYTPIPYTSIPFTQTHLRSRVSAILRDENNDGKAEHAYIYSYDILGNVRDLWQYIDELKPFGNQWKHTRYEFDLISGKVKKLLYQSLLPSGGGGGGLDQWLHKYFYNADNKLLSVQTSRDGWYWERDAKYEYYLHGPLKRTELGERLVQGTDYIYTINGWLKSLNAGVKDSCRDAGKDGCAGLNQFIPPDELKYSLHYFQNDYKAIAGPVLTANVTLNNYPANFTALYNGNIAGTMIHQDTLTPLFRYFHYDALNRIKKQSVIPPSGGGGSAYSYDKMGNILSLSRNATSPMDRMKYFYYPQSNKLSFITDSVPASVYPNDIDSQNKNNYQYDLLGNLIRDNSEKLKIIWTHYGKVKQIDSLATTSTTKLKFTYDALGNRLVKENTKNKEKEIYVRDAQGNIIALYKIQNDSLYLKELYIYGSQRVGYIDDNIFLAKKNTKIFSNFSSSSSTNKSIAQPIISPQLGKPNQIVNYVSGKKRYELNDWLGNVRVVVNDRKTQVVSSANVVTGYTAQVQSVSDYYPYGMSMAERSYEPVKPFYRFGFNTQEKVDEISGRGNHTTALFWEYDTRIGRRWNRDPKPAADESEYAVNHDNPILNNDPEGDCPTCPKPLFGLGLFIGTGGVKANFNFILDQQAGDFTGSYGLGVTYHSNFFTTGKGGFEFRNSLMVNYDDGKMGISLGTNLWKGTGEMKEFNQRTGMLAARSGNFGFSYENDGVPFGSIGLSDDNDRYRTAAASITVGEFSLNMNLLTGLRNKESFAAELDMEGGKMGIPQGRGQFGENYTHGFVLEQKTPYRYGGLTLNYRGISAGINSDRWVRHPAQNIVAHDLIKDQRMFPVLSGGINPVLNFSNRGTSKFTTWGQ